MTESLCLYREHFDFGWTVVRRLGVGAAAVDDVVQEVFIVIHCHLHTLERPEALRIMSNLTPLAEELVRAGRTRLRPTSADRERVLAALLAQIGATFGNELTLGAPVKAGAPRTLLAKSTAVLAAIAFIGGGLLLWHTKRPLAVGAMSVPAPSTALAAVPPVAPSPVTEQKSPEPPRSNNVEPKDDPPTAAP